MLPTPSLIYVDHFQHISNYDVTALHLIRQETLSILDMLEQGLNELSTDQQPSKPITELEENCQQLLGVFKFIQFFGAIESLETLRHALSALEQAQSKTMKLMEYCADSLVMLRRYIDFTMLHKKLIPQFLLSSTNPLRGALSLPLITEGDYLPVALHLEESANTADPVEASTLALLRKGVYGALTDNASTTQAKALDVALYQLYALHQHTHYSGFWLTAYIAFYAIQEVQPLSTERKRTLMHMERLAAQQSQQPHVYLAKETLAIALSRSHALAHQLREHLQVTNLLTDADLQRYATDLFNPTQDTVETLSIHLYNDIQEVKLQLDQLFDTQSAQDDLSTILSDKLVTVASTLEMVIPATLSPDIRNYATRIAEHAFTLDDYDNLQTLLLQAENTISSLVRAKNPTANLLPLNNFAISQTQVDEAYQALIIESRMLLQNTINALQDFHQKRIEANVLQEKLAETRHLNGSLYFLNNMRGHALISTALDIAELRLSQHQTLNQQEIEALADIISCIDIYLEQLLNRLPTSPHIYEVGEQIIDKLRAA